MRRFTERAVVLCGALSCVESFSSHGSFSAASCTADHDLSAFVAQPRNLWARQNDEHRRRGRRKCGFVLSLSESNDEEKDADSGLAPLFPELTNQEPPRQTSSYDEAADALQSLQRGRPSAGERGERALSASDEIRNAMASGGLESAAKAIQKAMSKGGDWYDREADALRDNGDMAAQGLDTNKEVGQNEEGGSPLTNLDFLLGRLDENNGE